MGEKIINYIINYISGMSLVSEIYNIMNSYNSTTANHNIIAKKLNKIELAVVHKMTKNIVYLLSISHFTHSQMTIIVQLILFCFMLRVQTGASQTDR